MYFLRMLIGHKLKVEKVTLIGDQLKMLELRGTNLLIAVSNA